MQLSVIIQPEKRFVKGFLQEKDKYVVSGGLYTMKIVVELPKIAAEV